MDSKGNKGSCVFGCLSLILIIFCIYEVIFLFATMPSKKEKTTEEAPEEITITSIDPNASTGNDISNNDAVSIDSAAKDEDAAIKDILGEDFYGQVKSILTDEIGFSEIRFDERQDETNNFVFNCDGINLMVTAFPDDGYIRVFEPSSENVFYEDGQLLLTKAEYEAKTIFAGEEAKYCVIAEEIVMQYMKNPASARFPSTWSGEWAFEKNGNLIGAQSYVEGKNDFGATVRSDFLVEFYLLDEDTNSYDLQFIHLGDFSEGELIPIS